MGRRGSRGRAYFLVLLVAASVLLAGSVALRAASGGLRIASLRGEIFGAHEFAGAANVLAIRDFEEAYLEARGEAHRAALSACFGGPAPSGGTVLPPCYAGHFREALLPLVTERLRGRYVFFDGALSREFEAGLASGGESRVFSGATHISLRGGGPVFRTDVNMLAGGQRVALASSQAVLAWPATPEAEILVENGQIAKGLDYFTPWVLELVRR